MGLNTKCALCGQKEETEINIVIKCQPLQPSMPLEIGDYAAVLRMRGKKCNGIAPTTDLQADGEPKLVKNKAAVGGLVGQDGGAGRMNTRVGR